MSTHENSSEPGNSSEEVDIIIRNQEPNRYKDLRLKVPLATTVLRLKTLISEKHPQRPTVEEQLLICGGRVLKEADMKLQEIVRQGEEAPYNFHLVLKSKETPYPATSVPNQGQSSTQTNTTSQVLAVPYMMVNPVVSAAYNAAIAAVYQPQNPASADGHSIQNIGVFPGMNPPMVGDPSQASSSSTGNRALSQEPQNQMVPAIAFFPLGIPVLVPAAAAQNHGFQIGQTAQTQTASVPTPQPQPQAQAHAPGGEMHRRQPQIHARRLVGDGDIAPNRNRRRRVVVYRISFRSVLQLVIVLTFLFISFSREKFLIALLAILGVYVLAGPIRRIVRRIYQQRDNNVGGLRGIIAEILALVLSLVSSIFPNWDVDLMQNPGNNDPESPRNQQPHEREAHPHAD